ncbi:hypothetical protein G3M81_12555 [Bacillus paralicheniformis]|uniref:hypothetical protein n=1 Tax=Bacillus TaxID=1386 RepID=UPI0013EF3D14|nr:MULTISPECIES: hypothetical protein [Bacillus]MCY8609935.1 hypothetical protein [Bacillus haynesii]MEC0752170.1 hypothetical protein [Bacillus haynesii]QII49519.1 hypothetical protein G3M81_12555 [Bacillus paralicheniformis]
MLVNKPQFDEKVFKYGTAVRITEKKRSWNALVLDNSGIELSLVVLFPGFKSATTKKVYAADVASGKTTIRVLEPKEEVK